MKYTDLNQEILDYVQEVMDTRYGDNQQDQVKSDVTMLILQLMQQYDVAEKDIVTPLEFIEKHLARIKAFNEQMRQREDSKKTDQ